MNFIEKLDKASREIAEQMQEVEVVNRAFCCTTCTLAEVELDHYIVWKVFSEGVNKNIELYENADDSEKELFGAWDLTDEQLDKAIKILSKYFTVEKPVDETKCIGIKGK